MRLFTSSLTSALRFWPRPEVVSLEAAGLVSPIAPGATMPAPSTPGYDCITGAQNKCLSAVSRSPQVEA
jgi:hypothetical protein